MNEIITSTEFFQQFNEAVENNNIDKLNELTAYDPVKINDVDIKYIDIWLHKYKGYISEYQPRRELYHKGAIILVKALKIRALRNRDVNLDQVVDRWGYTLLHTAIIVGYSEVVRLLLEAGANPNTPNHHLENYDHSWYTPLHLAVEARKSDIVKLLISYGANVNAVVPREAVGHHNGSSVLFLAMCRTTTMCKEANENVKLLIDAGADVNFVSEKFRKSLLNIAIGRINFQATKFLIDSGVIFDTEDTIKYILGEGFRGCFFRNFNKFSFSYLKTLCQIGILIGGRNYENDIRHFFKKRCFTVISTVDNSDKFEKFAIEIIDDIFKFVMKDAGFSERHEMVLSFQDTIDQEKLWVDIFQKYFDLEIDEAKRLTLKFLSSDFCKKQKAIYHSLQDNDKLFVPSDAIMNILKF